MSDIISCKAHFLSYDKIYKKYSKPENSCIMADRQSEPIHKIYLTSFKANKNYQHQILLAQEN
jgi:hypothetical protein